MIVYCNTSAMQMAYVELCGSVHTAQRLLPTQFPIGFCTNFIGICVGLCHGQCEWAIQMYMYQSEVC